MKIELLEKANGLVGQQVTITTTKGDKFEGELTSIVLKGINIHYNLFDSDGKGLGIPENLIVDIE